MMALDKLRSGLEGQARRNIDPHEELVMIGPDRHDGLPLLYKEDRESWQDDDEPDEVAKLTLFDLLAALDEIKELSKRKPIDREAEPIETDPGKRYMQILAEWQDDRVKLAYYKEQEKDKRIVLFAGAFPQPVEGVNRLKLTDGRTIKAQYSISRKIDEAALPITLNHMRELGVANTDVLVTYKPSLAKREWNTLSEDNKLAFSAAVIAKPGTPSLEIEMPKALK